MPEVKLYSNWDKWAVTYSSWVIAWGGMVLYEEEDEQNGLEGKQAGLVGL